MSSNIERPGSARLPPRESWDMVARDSPAKRLLVSQELRRTERRGNRGLSPRSAHVGQSDDFTRSEQKSRRASDDSVLPPHAHDAARAVRKRASPTSVQLTPIRPRSTRCSGLNSRNDRSVRRRFRSSSEESGCSPASVPPIPGALHHLSSKEDRRSYHTEQSMIPPPCPEDKQADFTSPSRIQKLRPAPLIPSLLRIHARTNADGSQRGSREPIRREHFSLAPSVLRTFSESRKASAGPLPATPIQLLCTYRASSPGHLRAAQGDSPSRTFDSKHMDIEPDVKQARFITNVPTPPDCPVPGANSPVLELPRLEAKDGHHAVVPVAGHAQLAVNVLPMPQQLNRPSRLDTHFWLYAVCLFWITTTASAALNCVFFFQNATDVGLGDSDLQTKPFLVAIFCAGSIIAVSLLHTRRLPKPSVRLYFEMLLYLMVLGIAPAASLAAHTFGYLAGAVFAAALAMTSVLRFVYYIAESTSTPSIHLVLLITGMLFGAFFGHTLVALAAPSVSSLSSLLLIIGSASTGLASVPLCVLVKAYNSEVLVITCHGRF